MVGHTEITRLAREMQEQPGEAITVQSMLRHVLTIFEDAEMASLSVRARRHTFTTLGATSPSAQAVDEAQYTLGEGPCVSSADDGEWFRSGDLSRENQWPKWAAVALTHGVRSFLSLPLRSKARPFGALTLYSSKLHAFDDRDDREDLDIALIYAVHAANALITSRLATDLETALDTRHDIGIAQGILIERYGMSIPESFAFLRRLSQSKNDKVRNIARAIAHTQEVPNLNDPADP